MSKRKVLPFVPKPPPDPPGGLTLSISVTVNQPWKPQKPPEKPPK